MRHTTFARVGPLLLLALACRSGDAEVSEPEAPAPPPGPVVSTEIVERLAADALERGVVGLAIGVAVGGEVVYASGFGHADLERTRPATEQTIFDAASVGKQFTAAAVLKLVEDGRLALDEPIGSYVESAPSNFPDATLFQLLTHTSGFVDGDLDEQDPPETWAEFRFGPDLLDDPSLTGGDARFRAGETWCYANSNYLLLGLAVDAGAGVPYHEYVADELLDPLDMGMLVCAEAEGELASGSFTIDDGEAHEVAFVHLSNYGGAGSIRSSVLGLLEWQRALDDGRILEPSSLNTMRSPTSVQGETDSALIPYGTGIRLGTLGTHAKFGHTGTFAFMILGIVCGFVGVVMMRVLFLAEQVGDRVQGVLRLPDALGWSS